MKSYVGVSEILRIRFCLYFILQICLTRFYFMSHITESHHASLTHVNYNSHLTLKLERRGFFYIFSQHVGLVFYLCSIFISVSGSNFRGLLNQMWCHWLHLWVERAPCWTFIFLLLVMWMEYNLSLGYRLLSFHHTHFHIALNGFPSETITPTLTKFKWDSISKLNVIWTFWFFAFCYWWQQLSPYIEFSSN